MSEENCTIPCLIVILVCIFVFALLSGNEQWISSALIGIIVPIILCMCGCTGNKNR